MDFKQVKIRMGPVTASLFKKACIKSGVSMASELTKLMAERTNAIKSSNDKALSQIERHGG
jgi:hypothetical protein